jgi:hypothetical protein
MWLVAAITRDASTSRTALKACGSSSPNADLTSA